LPYLLSKRFGIRGVWTPPMTYFLGPAVDEGKGSANNRFLKRMEITRELIDKLPKSSWQCVRCHGQVTDVIAFQEQRFRTYVQFTHEIAPGPSEELWAQMRNKTRNVIRRAEEEQTVEEFADIEEFIRLFEKNIEAKGERNTLDLVACRRLLTAALERERGRILVARNAQGEIVTANFCAWDSQTAYYIATTRSEAAGNGGTSLLLWEAIKDAAARGLTFDFAGFGTRGSILMYAGFGAKISPRYVAVRATGFARMVSELRSLFVEDHYFF
jgi:hypothetical protein